MLYNSRYWWFFLSQGNRWIKYLAHPKIQRLILCLLMFVSLVAFTQLTADLTPGWNGGSMFHPLSYIYAKTSFCCIETVANAFSLTNVHAKCWIHCLLISSTPLLSHATSIYDQPKRVCGAFWCFLGQLLNLDDLSIQYHLCVQPHLKSAYHLLTAVSDRAESE